MRIDSIELGKNATLTVITGPVFPEHAAEGEMFFKTTTDKTSSGFYCHVGGVWHRVSSTSVLISEELLADVQAIKARLVALETLTQ
jgi:hypothetical protein